MLDTRNQNDTGLGSGELWPRAVGVDQYWGGKHAAPIGPAPTIAFVDSGIEPGRSDFGNRIFATVDMTSLPGNSPGEGFGHGTLVAGLAAGSAPHYTGAAPTAGIVSLDVMDDQGMARPSDLIAAAQWILDHREE